MKIFIFDMNSDQWTTKNNAFTNIPKKNNYLQEIIFLSHFPSLFFVKYEMEQLLLFIFAILFFYVYFRFVPLVFRMITGHVLFLR